MLTKRPELADALRITLDATLDAFERNTAQHPPPGFADMPAAILTLQQTVRGIEERLARLDVSHPVGIPPSVAKEPRPSGGRAAAQKTTLLTTGLGQKKRLTNAGEAEMERRLDAGDSPKSIAEALGITEPAVRARVRKRAVQAPDPSAAEAQVPPPAFTTELDDAQRAARLLGWLRSGVTDEGLAQRLGVSPEEAATLRQIHASGGVGAVEALNAAASRLPSPSVADGTVVTPPETWTVGAGRARVFTPEGERRLHELIRTGRSNRAIARDLGINESRVRRARRAMNDGGASVAEESAPDPA